MKKKFEYGVTDAKTAAGKVKIVKTLASQIRSRISITQGGWLSFKPGYFCSTKTTVHRQHHHFVPTREQTDRGGEVEDYREKKQKGKPQKYTGEKNQRCKS